MAMKSSFVALFLIMLLAWPCQRAVAADPCARGELQPPTIVDGGKLRLTWSGTVTSKTARMIADEFDAYKHLTKSVELSMNSCGGRTDYMAATVGVLAHIKMTHQLTTVVERGATCASACIPIFLSSDRRLAALSSLWFFHRSWRYQMTGGVDGVQTKAPGTSSLAGFLDRYYASAGVSRPWLAQLKTIIETNDGYWQTGRDLWERKSGIITETIGDIAPFDSGSTRLAPAPGCSAMCRG
jgi:ATP-dependent protease ClpP protease subunit